MTDKPVLRQRIFTLSIIMVLFLSIRVNGAGELPELIPRDLFFKGAANDAVKVSPDGKYIARLMAPMTPEGSVLNVWIRTHGKNDDHVATGETERGIRGFDWAFDNRHILYLKDSDGDENFHVYAVDIKTGSTRDLTPFKGAKAQNLLLDPGHPDEILAGLNDRDKRLHDMYRVNLETGKAVMDTQNPGDVRWWLADKDFVIRAAVAIIAADSSTILRVRDGRDKPWRDLIHWPFGETGLLEGYGSEMAIAFTPEGNALYTQAAFNGDHTCLAKVDTRTGKVLQIIASDPNASIWNRMGITLYDEAQVLFHPKTGKVQAVGFNYLKPQWKILSPELEKDFAILRKQHKGVFSIVSRDLEDKLWTIEYHSDTSAGIYYLYDRTTGKATPVLDPPAHFSRYKFAAVEPVVVKARDGMDIPCYLTLPVGVPGKNLPMVVMVHGGPWARDEWGYDREIQLLANRGYAVLQVNFRGSTGFGKKFFNAGIGQWGVGSMQHDITDAVKALIRKGTADPKRIGIMGGSYGGYAVLAGLAFTPDLYACGVDLCGVSDVKTLLESIPDWWQSIKIRWKRRIGGNIMEDETMNRRISPLYHAQKIKAKLMIIHGSNDPRVKISASDRIVQTMRKNKQEVLYVVYPNEGHGIHHKDNLKDMWARVEEFLAKHLGGRAEPRGEISGSSAELH
jgi:dipeptidyl aminopeptidase/acylaminoacyl peptidase